jgi:hypothetical protein
MSNVSLENLNAEIKNGKLVITCDVSKDAIKKAPMSKSGKNKLVASTHGFVVIGDGLSMSLNLTSK